jgi:ketosteroid isomerase-like protein
VGGLLTDEWIVPGKEARMIGAMLAKRGVAEGYNAMNRRDLPAMMADWHDDAVFIYPGDIPASGTFEGKSAIEAWFRRYFEWFPEVRFEVHDVCVRDIFDLVGNNVIIGHWNVQVTNREGQTGRWSGVSIFTLQRGKVVALKDIIFDVGDKFRRCWGAA